MCNSTPITRHWQAGTYYFVSFIPYVGSAILLYFLVLPTKEDSPYREDKVNLLDEWNKEAEL